MSRIAVIIADLFEDAEYTEPADSFRKAGHKLVHVGLKKGSVVQGKSKGTRVRIDHSVENVSVDEFDALLIPGGFSPDKLRAHEKAVQFAGDFVKSGKPVLVICHGPQLLITADVLRDRKVTGWKSIIQDIKNAGAHFLDQSVVEDGNMISSRQPSDIPDFIEASLRKLKEVSSEQ